jgi:hypothetical protein
MFIERRTRRLAVLVIAIVAAQLGLYLAAWQRGPHADVLFYFDPRIGLSTFTDPIGHSFPNTAAWISVVALAVASILMLRRPALWSLKSYLIIEAVLAAPTLAFIALVLLANLSPSHGFSPSELLWPVLVFVVVSLTPWLLGYRLLRTWRDAG